MAVIHLQFQGTFEEQMMVLFNPSVLALSRMYRMVAAVPKMDSSGRQRR
jgi:hypothetical protein